MDLKTLNKYKEEGLLRSQTHPTLPLIIWNYTEKVQYESLWDEVTLSCRGLITDDKGKIIVKPFPKFFNYEEHPDDVPFETSEYVYIQNKMDGSLGILFNYRGEWVMATRGSFTSEQCIKGLEMLKSKYKLDSFESSIAYLCEIIYNENRIVVDYDFEDVKFLSAVINWSFNGWKESDKNELHWTTTKMYFSISGIKKEDIVNCKQVFNPSRNLYKVLKEKNTPNAEGFVLRFHPSNKRVKIKFEDYIRLHKVMTEISTTSIWESLKNDDDILELLKDVPDEFYDKINEYVNELQVQYMMIEDEYIKIYSLINKFNDKGRAEFAERAKMFKYPHILFRMLDNKDWSKAIWDIIKPKFRKL